MKQVRNHRIEGLSVGDEGTHHLSWYGFSIVFCIQLNACVFVDGGYVVRQCFILIIVILVQQKE